MNKARYVRSRWWVAASALGAFVAMFGALFAHDRDVFDASNDVEAAAMPVATPTPRTLPSTLTRGALPGGSQQPQLRQVQPSVPSTTTQPHTRSRAS